MIATVIALLIPAVAAAPSCERLAAGWASLDQALSALPLETACVTAEGETTAAEAWQAATREAASDSPGLPGCAQALGEPSTRFEMDRALSQVATNTRCVDVDGAIAVLRPTVTSDQPVPHTMDRWQPRVARYRPCESDPSATPCVGDDGLLRAAPSFLKTLVRPLPHFDRAIRQGMAAEGIASFDATVHIQVDERGRVTAMSWRSGPTWAEPAVTRALSRWRFEPVSMSGEPVPVAVDMTLRLGSRDPVAWNDAPAPSAPVPTVETLDDQAVIVPALRQQSPRGHQPEPTPPH